MRTLVRIIVLMGISLTGLFYTRPVLAFPPMPSSFYGTVKVNGVKVPDGTLVRAFINGQMYAVAPSQSYQGDSVYSLDVLGDDSSTTIIEGGRDGDTIIFKIGEDVANETGKWKSGTNINLNLSVSTTAPQNTPVPTITQNPGIVPEQTAGSSTTQIPTIGQTGIINPGQATEPSIAPGQSTPTTGVLPQDSSIPTALVQPTVSLPTVTEPKNVAADKDSLIFGTLSVVLILLFILWAIFVHKPKV